MEKLYTFLNDNEGKTAKAMYKEHKKVLSAIKKYDTLIGGIKGLITDYTADMHSYVSPQVTKQITQVDRADVWANIQSIDISISLCIHESVTSAQTIVGEEEYEKSKGKSSSNKAILESIYRSDLKSRLEKKMNKADKIYAKIKQYENTDDSYSAKAQKFYTNNTSALEQFIGGIKSSVNANINLLKGIGNGLTNIVTSLADFGVGALKYAKSGVAWLKGKLFGEKVPAEDLKNLKNFEESVETINEDPWLLVEGLAQEATDAIDVKGFYYGVGVLSADALVTILLTKGLTKLGKFAKYADDVAKNKKPKPGKKPNTSKSKGDSSKTNSTKKPNKKKKPDTSKSKGDSSKTNTTKKPDKGKKPDTSKSKGKDNTNSTKKPDKKKDLDKSKGSKKETPNKNKKPDKGKKPDTDMPPKKDTDVPETPKEPDAPKTPGDDIITDGSHILPDGTLKPNCKYKTGEYDYYYETDEFGRIKGAYADNLQLTTRDGRLPHNPGTPDKLPDDHAGHLIGDRFGGSPELDNLVSQLSKTNLSDYKKLENLGKSNRKWTGCVGEC